MNPTVRKNIAELPFNYTTYVLTAIAYLVGYWLDLPEAERQQWLATYPWLKEVFAVASAIAYIWAKIMPQMGIKPLIAAPEPLTGPQIGVAGLTTPSAAPASDTAGTMSLKLTASEIAAILNAAEALKKQAP